MPYINFGKRANDEHNTTLYLCNNNIQKVNCCKYLVFMLTVLYFGKIILNICIESY